LSDTHTTTEEPLDIRDTLSAAFEAADGAGAGSADETNRTAAEPKTPETPKADAQAKPADGSQPRDETGRFAPKDKAQEGQQAAPATQQNTDQTAVQQPEPQAQAADIRAPNAWSAPAKAKWASLDPDIRAEIAKREGEMQQGVAAVQARLEEHNRWEALISPHAESWAMRGMDKHQAVQALIAAQSILDRDPVNGLLQIARSYGVNLQQLASGLGPQNGAQPPLDPRVAQLYSQVSTLQQTLAQQQQAAEQARRGSLNSEIQKFADDPKNTYFSNVKDRMAALLGAGQASDLADAYDKACWSDPDIRKLILAEQSKTDQASQQQAARAKTSDARKAGGSLTGAPGLASAPANGASPSIRQSLEEAFG